VIGPVQNEGRCEDSWFETGSNARGDDWIALRCAQGIALVTEDDGMCATVNEAMRVFTRTYVNRAARAVVLTFARACVGYVINTSVHVIEEDSVRVIERAVANVIADDRTVKMARVFACAAAHPTADATARGMAGIYARESASAVERKSRASRGWLGAQSLVLTRSKACALLIMVN